MDWKRVPPSLVNDEEIYETSYGDIRHKKLQIRGLRTFKDHHGLFSACRIGGRLYMFHELVFWAHSNLSMETLRAGKVVFKHPERATDAYGIYKNWYKDMTLQPMIPVLRRIPQTGSSTLSDSSRYKYIEEDCYLGTELVAPARFISPDNSPIQEICTPNKEF